MALKHTLLTASAVAAIIMPQITAGYLSPEEVLLNRELFLPPSPREAEMRTQIQEQESASRREREQDAALDLLNPQDEEPVLENEDGEVISEPEPVHSAADDEELDDEDLELLRSLRLLTRVQENQELSRLQGQVLYIGGQSLHSGAPPLAPTGAGTVLATLVGLGGIIWTLWSVRRAQRQVRIS